MYVRPSVLVIYRKDHSFLLDSVIPKPGQVGGNYDLVIASQPWRARMSAEFKVKKVLAPLVRSLGPSGRLLAVQSCGDDPALEMVNEIWPDEEPFKVNRHELIKVLRDELGREARDFNFVSGSDAKSIFRYEMHTLPSEVQQSIGTSTLFAAWNAASYVAQIEDERIENAMRDGRPVPARHVEGSEEAQRTVVQRRELRRVAQAIARQESARRTMDQRRAQATHRRVPDATIRSRSPRTTRASSMRFAPSCSPAPPCTSRIRPVSPIDDIVTLAGKVQKLGLKATPHVIARKLESRDQLERALAALPGARHPQRARAWRATSRPTSPRTTAASKCCRRACSPSTGSARSALPATPKAARPSARSASRRRCAARPSSRKTAGLQAVFRDPVRLRSDSRSSIGKRRPRPRASSCRSTSACRARLRFASSRSSRCFAA